MIMMKHGRFFLAITCALLASSLTWGQQRRKVIINQDGSGPGGSNMQTIALLVQSPQVEVLGITVVSGNQWRDEEVAHTLRLLEIMGRSDIPVVPGAVFPLVRRREETQMWQQRFGTVAFAGAWDDRWWHEPFVVPPLPEGRPTTKAAGEDAAHFLIRIVRQYPHQVTIYEGGPMTNLALAISIDPEFPELAQQLVFMGGSLGPQTDDPEFVNNPRHEFNFWFDPEAAQIVLRAPWKKIVCTPTDISIKTRLTPAMIKQIDPSGTPNGYRHTSPARIPYRSRPLTTARSPRSTTTEVRSANGSAWFTTLIVCRMVSIRTSPLSAYRASNRKPSALPAIRCRRVMYSVLM